MTLLGLIKEIKLGPLGVDLFLRVSTEWMLFEKERYGCVQGINAK